MKIEICIYNEEWTSRQSDILHQCQKQIKKGAKFCPYCRAETDKSPTTSDKPVDREPVPTTSSNEPNSFDENPKQYIPPAVNQDKLVASSTSSKRGQLRDRTIYLALFWVGLFIVAFTGSTISEVSLRVFGIGFVLALPVLVFLGRKIFKRQSQLAKSDKVVYGVIISILFVSA